MRDYSRDANIWTIVELFYRTYHYFDVQHQDYERKVAELVVREGMPRAKIRLGPEELSGLLRFKDLEFIRDELLEPLKEFCHRVFRRRTSTDLLDRLVNDIFHEISILKEEHYNVMTYAVDPDSALVREEQSAILDEVHRMFPAKIHRLKHLFDTARSRLETILPTHTENTILTRSLFLNRRGFVREAHDDGLIYFYRLLHGDKAAFLGFRVVGDSFFESGFFAQAKEAFESGETFIQGIPPHEKRRLDPAWKETRDRFKRQVRVCTERLAEQAILD